MEEERKEDSQEESKDDAAFLKAYGMWEVNARVFEATKWASDMLMQTKATKAWEQVNKLPGITYQKMIPDNFEPLGFEYLMKSDALKHFLENQEVWKNILHKPIDLQLFSTKAFPNLNFNPMSQIELFNIPSELERNLRKYMDSPVFWANVRMLSRQLIIIPENYLDDSLELLSQKDFDLDQLLSQWETFAVAELKEELLDSEHVSYRFNEYLTEILDAHDRNPGCFRLLIPGLFLILEGTLSDVFKISERGMAAEIKRKMNIFWDMYHFVYLNNQHGITFSFSNRVHLTNIKEMFHTLTASETAGSTLINRNLVLHGKSHPKEWKHDDFVVLVNLLHVILVNSKNMSIMLDEFKDMIQEDETQQMMFDIAEYYPWLEIVFKKSKEKVRRSIPKTEALLKNCLTNDLSDIFHGDRELAKAIASRSDIHSLAVGLVEENQSKASA